MSRAQAFEVLGIQTVWEVHPRSIENEYAVNSLFSLLRIRYLSKTINIVCVCVILFPNGSLV